MLFVFSAPSGAGKTTIIRKLLKRIPDMSFSVSATTRKKRVNETDGKDYHFLSLDEFNSKKDTDGFAEFEEVHGNYYGTLKSEIEPFIKSDADLVLDVDVKGALSIKKLYPAAIMVFVDVPEEELLRRLKNRNTESDEEIQKRASRIKLEISEKPKFDHVIDNSRGIEDALSSAEEIIRSYKKK